MPVCLRSGPSWTVECPPVPSGKLRGRKVRYVRPIDEAQDLAAVIEESHRAVAAFTRGDSKPLENLFSQRDDVTLANPFGPAQRGWPRVQQWLEQQRTTER